MSAFFRRRIENTIEHMIELLDKMDGEPDLEADPDEEQHDFEADQSELGIADRAALAFVLAEMSRRSRIVK